jgi:hypothetical protein
MISVTAHVDSAKLAGFTPYAHSKLEGVVGEGIEVGERYMTSIVPHGETGRLASAVGTTGPTTIVPGHYVGSVGVNQAIAPHADKVDRGTGIDGAFRIPVSITRPSRGNPKRPGMMQFQKNGEPIRYRRTVKMRPSLKIQSNKNFSGRTHDAMRDWARIRTGVLAGQLALYFADRRTL